MNILLTGASGFLGNRLLKELSNSYDIETLGLGDLNNIDINLANEIPRLNQSNDLVLHVAGKAHFVPKNKTESDEFFKINLEGTKNLIKGIEQSKKIPKSIIFISTVAVYGLEYGENINEEACLKGTTPYAQSKIEAEAFLKEWCQQNNVTLGIIRPSLIAGKNPPGNLGTMIDGIKTGKYLRIGNGSACKSVLMAEDIARIIPKLVEVGGIYNVCANHHPSFAELEELISKQLNKSRPRSIPYWAAKSLAFVGDCIGSKFPINSSKLEKLTKSLTFSNEKAKRELDWEPLDVLENFKII